MAEEKAKFGDVARIGRSGFRAVDHTGFENKKLCDFAEILRVGRFLARALESVLGSDGDYSFAARRRAGDEFDYADRI